ncbi:MAG: carboxypeptidase regulatory-like domain-containing protein [Candidatus Sericytochromatia bacterium]|nr:carboxypeptidase regulatory-like domain-containing protein [Candidatus Sericytochromatia bacterium]
MVRQSVLRKVALLALGSVLLAGCGGRTATVALPDDRFSGGSALPVQNVATGTVTGRVVDARTGLGIPDVRVETQGLQSGTPIRTDGSGRFTLAGVPAQRVKLIVDKPGYTYLQGGGDVLIDVLPGGSVTAPDIRLTAQIDALPNAFIVAMGNLNRPRSLAIDPTYPEESRGPQNLYVLSLDNYLFLGNITTPVQVWAIKKLNLGGGVENTFGRALWVNELMNPTGLAVDRGGNLYAADAGRDTVRSFTAIGSSNPNGAFTNLSKPTDVEVMRNGLVAVAVGGEGKVQLLDATRQPARDPQGRTLSPIAAGSGVKGLASDANNDLYFIDDTASAGAVIRKVNLYGQVMMQFGYRGGRGAGYFENPTDLAVDPRNGDLYVVDTGNNRVQRFNRDGAFLSEFGGMGAGAGQFNQPSGIAVDREGYVYVADTNNNRIQKFAPSKSPFAGN